MGLDLFKGGSFDLADPGGFFKGKTKLNPLRRAAVDPLGLFYKPPEAIPSEAELASQDEARKQALRSRIDKLYGIGEKVPVYDGTFTSSGGAGIHLPRKNIVGYQDDPEVAAARAALDKEGTDLSESTRSYYTDQLKRAFEKAERGSRFNLARQGLLGGSADSDQQAEVRTDRDLGATRIDEAVRKAIAGLTTQREQERLNAINLVNAGVGESAIDAASSGLRTSFANANNQAKVDLFSDLFENTADAASAQNMNAQQAALAARFKNTLGSFFPSNSTTGGRVTATE